MPINTYEYATLFQSQLDKQILHEATSGWMEKNAGDVIYNGGREIKIPEISVQGLGDYDRDAGHPMGAVSFGYRTYAMTQDRARKFILDENDVNETNFGASAANVMAEFQRTKVVPEIDAYRYSKLANLAKNRNVNTITASNVWDTLYKQLYELADAGADLNNLIITVPYSVFAMICNNDKLSKRLSDAEIKTGDITRKVRSIDGAALMPVPSNRFNTSITTFDGKSEGQKEGGYKVADGASAINWIICPRSAPIAVSKTDRIKIFTPDVNQGADAFSLNYHKYHELLVPNQRRKLITVSTAAEFTPALDPKTDGSDPADDPAPEGAGE